MIGYDLYLGRGLVCAAALATLAGCSKPATPTVDVTKETASINAEIAAVNAGAKARDATKVVAYDADDLVAYFPGFAPVKSKADDLATNTEFFKDPAANFSLTVDQTVIGQAGDIAYQSGSYTQDGTNPATHQVEHVTGNWVGAYRKDADGTWKITALAQTPAPSQPPAKP